MRGGRHTMGCERLAPILRRRRVVALVGFDSLVVLLAYTGFSALRWAGDSVPWSSVLALACVSLLAQLVGGWALMVYRGRDAVGSAEETLNILLLGVMATTLAYAVNEAQGGAAVDRTLPWAAGLAAVAAAVAARAAWRRYVVGSGGAPGTGARRTILLGAGEATRQLVRSMRTDPDSPFRAVALLDDDPWRRHLRIDGIPVRGTSRDLERVVREHAADLVIVSVPSGGRELFQDISERAAAIGVDVKILPSVPELLGSRVSIRDVRDVDLADLLGRHPVDTDLESIADFLRGKRVLVTGAGGSIGSELCRQISRWQPSELTMLDRDESALHAVQLSIHGHGLLDTPDVVLADIRDQAALRRVFEARRPQVVFHAAALKHLPILEQYPSEAVLTNVVGTSHVLEAAERVGVERFVNISTDKAADPVSALGLSKRAAERITADFARHCDGTYLSVRFGNVLGSRGSVLTAWTAQIAQGGPVTVTHPEVTRYFMTIQEAVQLVIQAGAIGRRGEVMVLDMGEPVRIDDVARKLIEQSGQQIEIVYTGLREGEKLDEILIASTEQDRRPVHDLITHVTVPPLCVDGFPSTGEQLTTERARRLLRQWCEVDRDAPADGNDLESVARTG